MRIDAITTFPEMFDSVINASIMRRAQTGGFLDFYAHNLRDWTHDKHRTTDDEPYGGGHGLVIKCEPVFEALEDILDLPEGSLAGQGASVCFQELGRSEESNATRVIMLSPHGRVFNDTLASELSCLERIVFVCGHYEGMDERIYTAADEIISIGDYVLTSGELASMVVIDGVVRKIDGVLGAEQGAKDESFADGLLEYPQYTRPATFRGMSVPDVLLSGNHANVDKWRQDSALSRTKLLRPDLLGN